MSSRSRSTHAPRGLSPWGVVLPSLAAVLLASACQPPRSRTEAETDLGYPRCESETAPAPETLASRTLRAGPTMHEPSLVERFSIERRGCITVFTGRQEWALSVIDLDVVYDTETMLPQRVWKRTISPGPQPIAQRTDVRRFELRGERVALTRRTPTAELEHWLLRGARPTAVIGPGRGLLTMWIQRAHLDVDGRARESVLDVRESMEVVREVTLTRHEDRDDPTLGRVRVYTIYGREPVFTDEHDVVIGDMMGLVPAERVSAPLPPATAVPPPRPGDRLDPATARDR